MKFTRRTANILLGIAAFMFLTWATRLAVFVGEVQAGTLPAPAFHFALVVINLAIASYLAYLGVRARRANHQAGRVD
ncbi:MAG: hypothetical protein H0V53_00345 [Rubrobacter sp.]|nr:hypothetical protein [Rubrobacter sp.]